MAVYTEISPVDVNTLLASYAIGKLESLQGIAEGVENSNYLLTTSKANYILTLYEKRVNPDDLPFFLELMEHLAAKNVPCPVPIADKNGQVLQILCGRPAAMVSFLQGKATKLPKNYHLQGLGEAMALMHIAGQDFHRQRVNNFSLATWSSMAAALVPRADEVKFGLGAEIQEQLAFLQESWPKALPSGVIHADLFPDNVFFAGEKLSGIIDFYFACTDFLAYDIAICLNAWCFESNGEFNITKAKVFLSAYHAVRPLSDEEVAALPILASGAAMRFLLTRLHDWLHRVEGALVRPKNPLEYAQKLRFHQGISHPKSYGLYEEMLRD